MGLEAAPFCVVEDFCLVTSMEILLLYTCGFVFDKIYSTINKTEEQNMIYVMADIHGCYEEYKKLLEKINFCDEDELYVLGDVLDRGPEPIRVLQDMMLRPNVYPILGNHEYMALSVLQKLNVEITEENCETHLSDEDILSVLNWQMDGGKVTLDAFQKLSREEKEDVLDYLQEFSLYEEIAVNGKLYVLVHAGLNAFQKGKELDDYDLQDLIFHRADYTKNYFENEKIFLVTGHTPTFSIREDKIPLVYEGNGHIAIDCGCCYGKKLAVYCLNNGKAEYVEKL